MEPKDAKALKISGSTVTNQGAKEFIYPSSSRADGLAESTMDL